MRIRGVDLLGFDKGCEPKTFTAADLDLVAERSGNRVLADVIAKLQPEATPAQWNPQAGVLNSPPVFIGAGGGGGRIPGLATVHGGGGGRALDYAEIDGEKIVLKVPHDSKSFAEKVHAEASRKYREIVSNRERYLEAWVAETGLFPTECEVVEQHHGGGLVTFYVRKKEQPFPGGPADPNKRR